MKEPLPPQDALERRIDAALRRCFEPPATLATLAERARPRAGLRPVPWVLLAAAASLLASLVLWRALRPEAGTASELVGTQELAGTPATRSKLASIPPKEAAFCRLIGPLVEGQVGPGPMQRPDLVRLYQDMDACQQSSSEASCGQGDQLAQRMSATYGQPLELRPEAAGLLHGPFGSDEWPTGTIWTGTSEEQTAILVADRGTTLACCVHMELPASSGLRMFTWQVGDVVLTEITPFAEPRLIGYFE